MQAVERSEPPRVEPQAPRGDLLDRLLYIPFMLAFVLCLLTFDIVERISFALGGRFALKGKIVPAMCATLLAILRIVGCRVVFSGSSPAAGRPYIIVSNHQSLFDIPAIAVHFQKLVPQFIAKRELGKFIPGVSFSLRHSGDILIDRSNGGQALKEITKLARRINEESSSAVLFPEGTRARRGVLKPFRPSGFQSLLRNAPRAAVIPVAIENSWILAAHKFGPIPRGVTVKVTVLPLIEPSQYSLNDEVIAATENVIRAFLEQSRGE
jgi:1-acyl-sn-glycerol-3-phosphate acyltransferase